MPAEVASWDELLETLEARVRRWQVAAAGEPVPEDLEWPAVGPLPARLEARARTLLSGYSEAHSAMLRRRDALRVLVEGAAQPSRPTGAALFVDRRA